jgi:hypothetical protein
VQPGIAATKLLLDAWRSIHNKIIPTDLLSATDVAERAVRNRSTLAYACGELVGNATLRPLSEREAIATVIGRILPGAAPQGLRHRLPPSGTRTGSSRWRKAD